MVTFESPKLGSLALANHLIACVTMPSQAEIAIDYGFCNVQIKGRNLGAVFDALTRHTLSSVTMVDELSTPFEEGDVVVTLIEVIDGKK